MVTHDDTSIDAEGLDSNVWLIDEMYRKFLDSPASVSQAWQDFFADYDPGSEAQPPGDGDRQAVATPPIAPIQLAPEPAATEDGTEPTRMIGPSAQIAQAMHESLAVPTATSVRTMPAKLLEVNRRIVNNQLARLTEGGKVSFTHLIGWAVVRALREMPDMNVGFAEIDGQPHRIDYPHINLGLAVDHVRKDGTRTLLVPNIKAADELTFREFWAAYEEVIHKVRAGNLSPDDFAGTTVSLTNPGTVGTVQSVPRLMASQGVIVGVGAIQYPPEYQGADQRTLARLGIGRAITLTSTYDHRVIQGARSGMFLARIHELLLGADEFYEDVFRAMKVPYTPARWAVDENPPTGSPEWAEKQARVFQLINMYRVRGHLIADLDPLRQEPPSLPAELDLMTYGLTIWDLDRTFATGGLGGEESELPLVDILGILRDAYGRTMGIEYMHIQDPVQKRWIQERLERSREELSRDQKLHILRKLNDAEAFEKFLHTKYVGQKRFGLEGVESLISLLDAVAADAIEGGMEEIIIGMAHRGRLNVLANIVGKSYQRLFQEFEGDLDVDSPQGSGDVKYHLGASGIYRSRDKAIAVEVVANPSHLEAVGPVLEGAARAKQERRGITGHAKVLPLLLHGDAAFAGQGVVVETLNLSQLLGYRTGGTVHVVVNNQVGFTTSVEDARSSHYATDVAKTVQAPIIHVNADDPEMVVWAAHLAFAYRQAFNRDVVIDLIGYRRRGHNEGDEPSYTQPVMYRLIEQRRTVRKLYMERLVNQGDITLEEGEALLDEFRGLLQAAFDETKDLPPGEPPTRAPEQPHGVVDTAASPTLLDEINQYISEPPDGFVVHPKLVRFLEQRRTMFLDGRVDWSLAEALAIGSLAKEGTWIRLSGEDVRRGTFSQRHAVMVDYTSGVEWIPLQEMTSGTARVRFVDSLLSEFAAVGFEYGYSVINQDALVAWEAQFGDFSNGAQVVFDQFLAAGEDKWGQHSRLAILLPHGYEGQGPEHSSARIERFLQLSATHNVVVAVPSTASQYFHLLRRQVRSPLAKPLIAITPKSLLRAEPSFSAVEELTAGAFRPVIDDLSGDPSTVKRVVFCYGKLFYELDEARRGDRTDDIALVRVEELYPVPREEIKAAVDRFSNAEVVWAQEEPENMGAWFYYAPRLRSLLGGEIGLVSRPESASPATGSVKLHHKEQQELVERALTL